MAHPGLDDIDDQMFDDHPSLSASLEDFEDNPERSPMFGIPSQHSGFKSEAEESEADAESSNGSPWSPPGFQKHRSLGSGSGWFRQDLYGAQRDRLDLRPSNSPSISRQSSPEYQDAEEGDIDLTIPANIPLPRGTDSPLKGRSPSPAPVQDDIAQVFEEERADAPEVSNNYVRFAMRAEVQHAEPFTAIIKFFRETLNNVKRSRFSTIWTVILGLFSMYIMRIFLLPTPQGPVPDLIKLSTMAKSFEPVIYYSQNGYGQMAALQETSVAVWDLSESVRSANMTSTPLIVRALDELSESLKSLGVEYNRFFADVDADIDSILMVMDWASRELSTLQSYNHGGGSSDSKHTPGALTRLVIDNIHHLLNQALHLEDTQTGNPTTLGRIITDLLGESRPQRIRSTMVRTFNEFLSVLEEAINTELTRSTALFALFESIDRQFLNLQRAVIRETDTQERLESDLLSSLWTRVLGSNAALLRKFEKNKQLLLNVRSRTVQNKRLLVDHHSRLQTLKVGLETLRRKLVSPLVRRNGSASLAMSSEAKGGVLEGQIKGLEGTYEYLKEKRDEQKRRLLEMIYGGAGGRRMSTISGEAGLGLEER
ncbi:MAG: hypothetical protein Q9160_003338 [Pyrenula sp. 1 TL-2023]